ncbi:MAG: cellulase family glycosylhydrolase [Mangrovibacterium sp.]
MKRRQFLQTAGVAASALSLAGFSACKPHPSVNTNKLPYWKGFNLLDYFDPSLNLAGQPQSTEEQFKWMAGWGFNFVRIPMAYPRYLDFDQQRNITPDDVIRISEKEVDKIEALVEKANKHGLHVSLNLHRAPGFCVNAGFNEPYNLWKDKEAQEAFYFHWGMWAKRFASKTPDQISFDLVNEPCTRDDMNDQFSERSAVPGGLYREVAQKAMETIRHYNPGHRIIADGNNVGAEVIPELFGLDIGQSCRGYYPHYISHYRASWVYKNPDDAPTPVWPGTIDGQYFDRNTIEQFYQPWIEAVKNGVGVHCGECGCWRETPHPVFLAWFNDVLGVLSGHGIGYALWAFDGSFGLLNSGRSDVDYEDWYGQKLDRKLLDLLTSY